ncbi:N-acetylmuramidase family protein [Metapseudomonas resinovorans]|uniref:N-acetylmuramidase family protein n=1 Tax=Metapseudomonas resinovorans TaxID=53412 RepID=UPI000414F768|nr:N-acetylmuramidase family protein [Pseudomonas resinovorans]
MAKRLGQQDYIDAAPALGVPVAAVKAVVTVESRGNGFYTDGRPVILFERHVFRRQLAKRNIPTQLLELQHPEIVNAKAGGYRGGAAEHDRLDAAAKINRDAALESASWGLFQLMGFHWQPLGFSTLQAFVNAMYRSEGDQLQAFVAFVKANPGMHAALKARDWAKFARLYNGAEYARNAYDQKLAEAYSRFI